MAKAREIWRLPPVLWLLCAAAGYGLQTIAASPRLLPAPFQNFGPILFVAGGLVIVIAAAQFLRSRTNIHAFRDPERLITTGVFAYSRNPIYLGFTIMLIGLGVYWNAAHALWPALAFFLVANFWYAPSEEAAAERVFGEPYRAYRRKVRRWI